MPLSPVETAVAPAPTERRMSRLRPGDRGRVARIDGDSVDSRRLKALGLCEGREVTVLRTGDAWVVRVLGSRIGLSPVLAATILLSAA